VRAPFELSARQKFLARIVQPDVFFVLLILGVLGLYTEFTHPGVIAPGVIGGICLVLALYAMNFLPINLAGLFLIALALAFFILEAKAPSTACWPSAESSPCSWARSFWCARPSLKAVSA